MIRTERVTQDRVYRALKQDLFSGVFHLRERMDLTALANRYGASKTPLREAVFRLVAEQLLAQHPEGGYQIGVPDAARLAALYFWNAQHLLAALHVTSSQRLAEALEPFRHVSIARDFHGQAFLVAAYFQAIGAATHNAEFVDQVSAANARLHYPDSLKPISSGIWCGSSPCCSISQARMSKGPSGDAFLPIIDVVLNMRCALPGCGPPRRNRANCLVGGQFRKRIDPAEVLGPLPEYIMMARNSISARSPDLALSFDCRDWTALTKEGIMHRHTEQHDDGVIELGTASAETKGPPNENKDSIGGNVGTGGIAND